MTNEALIEVLCDALFEICKLDSPGNAVAHRLRRAVQKIRDDEWAERAAEANSTALDLAGMVKGMATDLNSLAAGGLPRGAVAQ